MSNKELIKKVFLYIFIGILILSNIWLYTLYSMQKDILNTYKETFIEEHLDESGEAISNSIT